MNLPSILAQAASNSYFSRSPADLLSAANSAGLLLFQAVEREMRGNFLKVDTTSLTLTPGQTTYLLPADFDSLIHLAERPVASVGFAEMRPMNDIGLVTDLASQPAAGLPSTASYSSYGAVSPYTFYGPYLPAPDDPTLAQPSTPSTYAIRVAPQIDRPRQTELIYIARWLELTTPQSWVMLPDPATPAFLSLTSAALLDMNGDTLAETYRRRAWGTPVIPGETRLLLSWARSQALRDLRIRQFGNW